jgi:CRISPR/Cas system CSM-associated protein Csm3 (group 7 of RAMP superfamily)
MTYKLTFHDYWHLSSGLSGGAKLDSSVVKDTDKLPYVPGKTIKGLVRDCAMLATDHDWIRECFGDEGNMQGIVYFSNAELMTQTKKEIVGNQLQDELYDTLSSTAISDKGIAIDGSLREIEVVIPLVLYGKIENCPEYAKTRMIKALKNVKRMGLNRHRGLGRCSFEIMEDHG